MKKSNRYKTNHLTEDQYEPGSNKKVLKNLLGIKKKREIDQVEAFEQLKALEKLVRIYSQTHRFTAKDICQIARILSNVMALQAGLPTLDFSTIKGKRKEDYFAAVRFGLNRDYEPMQKIFMDVIKTSMD